MADLVEESVENLRTRLDEYKANWTAISQALETEPESAELGKLKADLEEVIASFTDLIALKETEEYSAATSRTVLEEAVSAEKEAPAHVPAPAPVIQPAPGTLALIGRTCVSTKDPMNPMFGTITALGDLDPLTGTPLTVKVYWLARKQTQNVPVGSVRLRTTMPPETITAGMEAQALYSDDGMWYKCTVDAITEEGYLVTYQEYGNSELVPADRLRPAETPILPQPNAKKSSTDVTVKKKVKEVTLPNGMKVPANLIVRATDTEAQKANKRRRLKAYKREQKSQAEESAARIQQNDWKSHVSKSMTKATHRVGTALLHDYRRTGDGAGGK